MVFSTVWHSNPTFDMLGFCNQAFQSLDFLCTPWASVIVTVTAIIMIIRIIVVMTIIISIIAISIVIVIVILINIIIITISKHRNNNNSNLITMMIRSAIINNIANTFSNNAVRFIVARVKGVGGMGVALLTVSRRSLSLDRRRRGVRPRYSQ